MRQLITVACIFALTACATKMTKLPVGPITNKNFPPVEINLPVVNEVNISNVGENIISKTPAYQKQAIQLKTSFEHTGVNLDRTFILTLEEGIYVLEGEDYRGKFYESLVPLKFTVGTHSISVIGGIVIPHNDSGEYQIYWRPNDMPINRISNPHIRDINYSLTTYEEAIKEKLSSRIIYKGISDNQVKFVYKEFINDMARPAFSMDISYDYTPNKEVGFKNARFTIIKATSTELTYKVRNHF